MRRACLLVSSSGLAFFFFSSRRRHTRLQGDWSSDVCSSDLFPPCIGDGRFHDRGQRPDEERAAAPSRTIALSMRASSATAVIPRDGRAGGGGGTGFARKTPTARNPPIEPRARAPLVLPREPSLPIRAVPLRPGQAREGGLAGAGSGSRGGGEAAAPTTSRTQGIALPPALFYGAQARVPATRTGVRRR